MLQTSGVSAFSMPAASGNVSIVPWAAAMPPSTIHPVLVLHILAHPDQGQSCTIGLQISLGFFRVFFKKP